MNTTENNKNIAEFMGCDFTQIGKRILVSPTSSLIGTNYIDKLLYHSDWNWLMEVVEKIESFEDENRCAKYNVNITQNFVDIYDNENSIEIVGLNTDIKIQAVYNACVEFIKWYNQQTK